MAMTLTPRDNARMVGVHPDLVRVVHRAARDTTLSFTLLEGVRSLARQKQLVAAGASTTMRSRHLTGHAVDLAPLLDLDNDGKIETSEMFDWPLIRKLAPIIKAAAAAEGVALEWGGDWKKFKDGPHWQLSWKAYP